MTDLRFTYAGVTVGNSGDSSYHLVDRYSYNVNVDSVTLSFFVVVQNDNESTFVSKEAALRTAYSTPHGTLAVVLGATTRHTYSPSAGTGFNARPSFRKVGEDEDTGRSAKYECTVDLELPATLYSADGRRDHGMTVSFDESGLRTVVFQGTWTRSGTTDARAQYDAQIASFVSTQLDALDDTVTWELLPHQSTNDDRDNVVQFQRAYQEILDDQSISATDVAALKRPNLQIDVTESAPGDSPSNQGAAIRLTEATVTYSAAVDKAETSGTANLKALYDATIRPLLLNRAAAAMDGRQVIVVAETYSLSPTGNRVSVAMTINSDGGGTFITYVEETQDDITLPIDLDTVWDGSDYNVDLHHTPAPWLRTVTRTALYVDGRLPTALKDQQVRIPGFVERRRIQGYRDTNLGRTSNALPLVLETDIRIFQRADIRATTVARVRTG